MSKNQLLTSFGTFFYKRKMVPSFKKLFRRIELVYNSLAQNLKGAIDHMIQRLHWNEPEDIQKMLAHIKAQHLFIGSTDTVLGIMGNVAEPVLKKIDNVKIRQGKPYVILVDSMRKAEAIADIKRFQIEKFLRLCWPGTVTVILNKKEGTPDYISSAPTVALRIPDHEGLKEVISHLPYGLYSTSANVAGETIPDTINEVVQCIKDTCHYYINNGKQETVPSTIIDCSQGDMRIIRPGAYPIERLQKLYHQALD